MPGERSRVWDHARRLAHPPRPAEAEQITHPVSRPVPVAPALLTDPRLQGRGNGSVRAAALQRMQQTAGNRATRRLYRPARPLQREPTPDESSAPETATAPPEEEGLSSEEFAADLEEYADLELLALAAAEETRAADGESADEESVAEDTAPEVTTGAPAPVQSWRAADALVIQRAKITTSKKKKRKKTRRLIALGATPGKGSATGRKVLERWHNNGKAKWTGTPGAEDYKQPSQWQVYVKDKSGTRVWKTLDSTIHMGHRVAAVDFWEKGAKGGITKPHHKQRYKGFLKPAHQHGFKSKYARRFMLYHANYRFEYGPANSSAGAKMRERYLSLPPGAKKWPKN